MAGQLRDQVGSDCLFLDTHAEPLDQQSHSALSDARITGIQIT